MNFVKSGECKFFENYKKQSEWLTLFDYFTKIKLSLNYYNKNVDRDSSLSANVTESLMLVEVRY